MVGDSSTTAFLRLKQELNYAGYPSTFFDGGDEVIVGGYEEESVYTAKIEQAGWRTVPNLDLRTRMTYLGNNTVRIYVRIGNGVTASNPPAVPSQPNGVSYSPFDSLAEYTTSSTDPDGDSLYYQFSWGDNSYSDWVGPYASGEQVTVSHSWNQENIYQVRVKTRDIWGDETNWSPNKQVYSSCCIGNRGNVDGDSGDQVDISDLLYFVDYAFQSPAGPTPPCINEADVDGSGQADISDILFLVDYMFTNPPPQSPVDCNPY